jgi:hypothetical protein
MPPHGVVDNGEAQAATLRAATQSAVDAIELAENALLLAA